MLKGLFFSTFILVASCALVLPIYIFLDFWDAVRLGRPGVDSYCQHESGAAVLQLQFLINEVSRVEPSYFIFGQKKNVFM